MSKLIESYRRMQLLEAKRKVVSFNLAQWPTLYFSQCRTEVRTLL